MIFTCSNLVVSLGGVVIYGWRVLLRFCVKLCCCAVVTDVDMSFKCLVVFGVAVLLGWNVYVLEEGCVLNLSFALCG